MKDKKIHLDDFGRSPKISYQILDYLKCNKISSVSVMVGFVDSKFHRLLIKKKVKTKLHLNLTDNKNYEFNKKSKDTSFFSLFFLKKKYRRQVFHEIDKQINEYKKIYDFKKISLDGHQHIHFIPWIYKHLCTNKKYNISELRYPNEKFNFPTFKVLIKIKFYRNLIAWLLLKFFSIFNEKKTKKEFFGILYSSIYDEKILNHQFTKYKFINKEILLHLGNTDSSERKLFSKKFFNYFTSNRDFKTLAF
tara:strand:+ start:22111 stop:22857 length:747 start_codon:yes stop_codon:yes gene_type:complete